MTTSLRRTAPLLVALLLGATVVVAAPACGDDSSTGTGGSGSTGSADGEEDEDGEDGIGDVVYEGGATDEALEELLAAAAPTSSATESAAFTAPLPDTALPGASPATFSWALPSPQGSNLELFFDRPGDARHPGAWERAAATALRSEERR